jgi:hypothetical protein
MRGRIIAGVAPLLLLAAPARADDDRKIAGNWTAQDAQRARSMGGMAMSGGMFGSYGYITLPLGLLMVVARFGLAALLRRPENADPSTKPLVYHEPEPVRWRPPEERVNTRLHLLDPEYVAPEPRPAPAAAAPVEVVPPVPAPAPLRQFGKRGL